MNENVNKFIDSVQKQDYTAAKDEFQAAMAEKINSSFENKKIELASQMAEGTHENDEYLEESRSLKKAGEKLGEYLGNFANNHPVGKFGKLLRNKFPSIKKGSARALAREFEYRADDVDDLLKRIDTGQEDLFGDSVDAREIKRLKAELQAYTKAADKFSKMSEHLDEKKTRQMMDPDKETMVVKDGKVEVIDKKDVKKYMKKGYELAEETDDA